MPSASDILYETLRQQNAFLQDQVTFLWNEVIFLREELRRHHHERSVFSLIESQYDGQPISFDHGCILFVVRFHTISSLDEFWSSYKSGRLLKEISECLLTDDLKKQAGCELDITLDIDKSSYLNAVAVLGM